MLSHSTSASSSPIMEPLNKKQKSSATSTSSSSSSSPSSFPPPPFSSHPLTPLPIVSSCCHLPPQASSSSSSSSRNGTALLVIDVQNDFVEGSLKAPDAHSIIPVINSLRHIPFDLVLFSQDTHPSSHVSFYANHACDSRAKLFELYTLASGREQKLWPVHCIRDSWGFQLHPALTMTQHDGFIYKGVEQDVEYYSAFLSTCGQFSTGLAALLKQHDIKRVVVCGLVYEYCVGNTAIDAAKNGFETIVLSDATKSLTSQGERDMYDRLTKHGVTVQNITRLLAELNVDKNTQDNVTAALATTATPDNKPANSVPHILLGLTGSVACVKTLELLQLLSTMGHVRIIATKNARFFVDKYQLQNKCQIYYDEDEWKPYELGNDIMHIELRKWADVLVVAPLDANTLAKIAHGIADNLLTSVVRCWSFASRPVLVAPAMNTMMLHHPLTSSQLSTLQSWGAVVVAPQTKLLACGDYGNGAMAHVNVIAEHVRQAHMKTLEIQTKQTREKTQINGHDHEKKS